MYIYINIYVYEYALIYIYIYIYIYNCYMDGYVIYMFTALCILYSVISNSSERHGSRSFLAIF